MLQHMHDHFINQFDFFMRADDDVYVRVDRLTELLGNINPAQDIYMGSPGFGKVNDRNRIKLQSHVDTTQAFQRNRLWFELNARQNSNHMLLSSAIKG